MVYNIIKFSPPTKGELITKNIQFAIYELKWVVSFIRYQ